MSKLPLYLIFNPKASSTSPKNRERVLSHLSADYQVLSRPTEFSGHATEIAREIVQQGNTSPVVVLGGDGTANQVACGLMGSPVAMLAIPGGSTSVFARSLGCPRGVKEALAWGLHALREGDTQLVDMGEVGNHPFLFSSGFGLDADTARQVDQRPHLKARFKGGFFAWTALGLLQQNYVRGDMQIDVQWDEDGVQKHTTGITVLLQNGPTYSYLGERPLVLDPEGDYQSGTISGIMVKGLSELSSASLAMKLLAGIEEPHNNKYLQPIGPCCEIRIQSSPAVECQVDGEALGSFSSQTVRCLPRALRVYGKKEPSF